LGDTLFTPTEVTKDLHLLEKTLQRLSVEYEMFLTRMTRWPPHQRMAESEAIIRHYSKHPPQRTADRFRFNTLVHRHRMNIERWNRRVRQMEEEGPGSAVRSGRRDQHVEDLDLPQVLLCTRLMRGEATGTQLRDMYLAYRTARKARGLPVSSLSYAPFADRIGEALGQARERNPGCDFELRLDEVGGKVRVAVRPAPASAPEPAFTGQP